MYNEKYVIDSFGDRSSLDYMKTVPVEYLRELGFPESEIEAAVIETEWNKVKSKRTLLLSESDWMVTRAADTGVAISDEWQQYRQALRDITNQSNPFEVVWPVKPE